MTRSQRLRRPSMSFAVGAAILLVGAMVAPTVAQDVPGEVKSILRGDLADDADVFRALEAAGDLVGADGLAAEGKLPRIDVRQFDLKVGKLDKNDRKWWNKNAKLGDPNVIYGADSDIDPDATYLTMGFRLGGAWKPGKMMQPLINVRFDGPDAVDHTAGPGPLIEGSSSVQTGGNFDYGDGNFALATGGRSAAGFSSGAYDLPATLRAVLGGKGKELRALVPVPDGAANVSVVFEETVNGVYLSDLVTLAGGQAWFSLAPPRATQSERCLTLAVTQAHGLDGSSTPVLHGRMYDPDGMVPPSAPFDVGVVRDDGSVSAAFEPHWSTGFDDRYAWVEYDAEPGSLVSLSNGQAGGAAEAAGLFFADGWHSLASVMIGASSGGLIGDPNCGGIPTSGGCFGNLDWSTDLGLENAVVQTPYRGHDGSWRCVHVLDGAPLPFLDTGMEFRGVDAAWLERRAMQNYGYQMPVDLGLGGVLIQSPNGVAGVLWYDEHGFGYSVEHIPSDGLTEVPEDYEAGAPPPGGLMAEGEIMTLLGIAREYEAERLADPLLGPFIEMRKDF